MVMQGSSGLNTIYSVVNSTGLALAGATFLGLGGNIYTFTLHRR
jgi:hypothetical protein